MLSPPCSYIVSPLTPSSLPLPGGNIAVTITTNGSCTWAVGTLPDWITVSGLASGSGSGTATLVVAANAGLVRNVNVSIAGATVAVSQSGITCNYGVSSLGQVFPAAGGPASVNVTTQSPCAWTAGGVPSWITVSGPASPTGSGTVTFTAAANSGSARSALLTIAGIPFDAEQNSGNQTFSSLGSLAHYDVGGIWDTTFTLVNTTGLAQTAQWNFFNNAGAAQPLPLSLPASNLAGLTGATIQRTLNPGALLTVNSSNRVGATDLQGGAQLQSSGGIDGFGVFRSTSASGNVQEAVVPLETRGPNSFVVAFDNTNGYFNGVALSNRVSSTISVAVTVREAISGNVVGTHNISLPGNGHVAFLLNDATLGYPETANIGGTLRFDVTASGNVTQALGQLSVLGLRFSPSGAFTSTPVFVPASAATLATAGSGAHFAVGGGWKTTFTLVNTSSSSSTVVLKFADDSGNPLSLPLSFPQTPAMPAQTTSTYNATLAPGTLLQVQAANPANPTQQTGWAQLTASGGATGFAVFEYQPLSGGKQEAVVPFETRQANSYVLAYDNTNRYFSGVAVSNTTSAAVNVTVTVRDGITGAVSGTHALALPAMGHKAFLLSDATLGYPETANGAGTIEYSTGTPGQISVLGLRFNANAAFTSTPALAK